MIVAMITASALVASCEAIRRLVHPQAVEFLGAVMVASVMGFTGNEVVAIFRIRVGRQIGKCRPDRERLPRSRGQLDQPSSHRRDRRVGQLSVGRPRGSPPDFDRDLRHRLAVGALSPGRALDAVEPEFVENDSTRCRSRSQHRGSCRCQARWIGHRLHADVNLTYRRACRSEKATRS